MNPSALKLGYGMALVALIATLGYGAAQIAQVAGWLGYPVADIIIYATSLGISAPYLVAILVLSETADPERRVWALGASAFGVMYVTYVALMYTVQLSSVMPNALHGPSTGLLSVAPHSLFWDIDALGYIAMGISALFAGLSLTPSGSGLWARRFLLAHGLITPLIAFIYFYPHFSVGLLMLGTPWLITASGSLLGIAAYLRARSREN